MLDFAQLQRCNNNWTVSLILIAIFFGLSLITVVLRVLTNFWIARKARNGNRRFLWSDKILFLGFVSTLRPNDYCFYQGLMRVGHCCFNFYLEHILYVTVQIRHWPFSPDLFFVVAVDKNPALPDDMNDLKVGKMNFATHIGWLTVLWAISSSVLLYYDCIFEEVIHMGRVRLGKTLLVISHLLVFVWWLSSVFHYITLLPGSWLTADR